MLPDNITITRDQQRAVLIYILQHYSQFYGISHHSERLVIEKADLDTALGLLTDKELAVVNLLHLQGYTIQETADKLGRSTFYVHSHARGAIDKLVDYCLVA